MEHILCGAGADEVIDLLARAFIEPGDAILDLPPTFGMYKWEADMLGARYVTVPRRADFSIDVEAVGARRCEARPRRGDAEAALRGESEQPGRLGHAAGATCCACSTCRWWSWWTRPTSTSAREESLAPLVRERSNLVVLRTFSKLAGHGRPARRLRAVAAAGIIKHIWKVKQPYTPNVAGTVAALAALTDRPWLDDTVKRLVAERERLVGRACRTSTG